jgi:hypothetical protein
VAHEPTVVGEAPVRVLGSVRSEEPLDDHRENWDVGGTDGAIDRDIDCGVLQRAQPSLEHGLGKRADEVAAAGCDLAGPLRIVETGGAMALVERVESVRHPVAERDGSTSHRLGDRGVLALRIPGHIHPAAERDGPRVEALGEAGLTRTHDAGKDQVRCGDQTAGVEDPRVVDERATRVEIVAHEDPFAAQTALGEKRVRACERRRRVLMPRDSKSSRCSERGRSRFTSTGERDGLSLLSGELFGLALRLGTPGFAVGGQEFSGSRLAQFAIAPAFPAWRDKDSRM